MDLLRHGAMGVRFGGVRAPSTLGSFLRALTWGNVLQLGKVHRQFLAEPARRVPVLAGTDALVFAGIDSPQKRVYGHQNEVRRSGSPRSRAKTIMMGHS